LTRRPRRRTSTRSLPAARRAAAWSSTTIPWPTSSTRCGSSHRSICKSGTRRRVQAPAEVARVLRPTCMTVSAAS
jgi:hypothetical protein